MQRYDLENVPAFLACGMLYVAISPPLALANVLFFTFVAARLAHAVAYLSAQRHEVRATFYSIGSIVVILMAVHVLVAALTAA